MTMASNGSGTFGRLTLAFPSSNSIEWKGFGSREIWERSQTSSFCSTTTSVSPSAKNMAQKASVSNAKHRKEPFSSFWGSENQDDRFHRNCYSGQSRRASQVSRSMPLVEARLFGPSIFNASKLRVLLLGKDDHETPLQHPRIYTLTHSDITAKITLAVAREINKAQVMGWYSKLQRDEVVAEWRKTQGEMSLHVHCHISGTNFLHKLIAKLRFYIFQKELPLVLEAFMHGDRDLFEKHPELQNAPVWVYFDSNVEEYNRVECWGPLVDATKRGVLLQQPDAMDAVQNAVEEIGQQFPMAPVCLVPCECCSRYPAVIPIPESLNRLLLQSQELSIQSSITRKDTPNSS